MINKKVIFTPIIALTLVLTGCSNNDDVPSTPISDPTETQQGNNGAGDSNGGGLKPGEKPTNSIETPVPTETFTDPPVIKEEDIKIVEEGASQKDRSLFWEENVFKIDPEKVFIPESVKEVFEKEEYSTLANSVLAILSEATMITELKAPYTKDTNPMGGQLILRGFSNDNLTGAAQELFEKSIEAYPESIDTSARLWHLYPHITESNSLGGHPVRANKGDDVWITYVDNFAVTGIDEEDILPRVTVEYDVNHVIPVINENGEDKYFSVRAHMTLVVEPGVDDGEWLISDYSYKTLN